MSGTDLEAIADDDLNATGGWGLGVVDTIDVATGLLTSDSSTTPKIDNVQFGYTD